MDRYRKLANDLETINAEIDKLSDFRDSAFTRRFRRQLEGEKSVIKAKIAKITQTLEQKDNKHQKNLEKANKNRHSKMTRYWNYMRAIKTNYFPNMSLNEIRRQHKNPKK